MRLQDLCEAVRETNQQFGMSCWELPTIENLLHAALGLTSEANEFADEVKKCWREGSIAPERKIKSGKELVDVLIYIGQAANILGINLDEAWREKLTELAGRTWPVNNNTNLYELGMLAPKAAQDGVEAVLQLATWHAQGVSDEEQARRLGVTVDVIRNLQRKAHINTETAKPVSIALNASSAYLVGAYVTQGRKTTRISIFSRDEEVMQRAFKEAQGAGFVGVLTLENSTYHLELDDKSTASLLEMTEHVCMNNLQAAGKEAQIGFVGGIVDTRGGITSDGSRLFVETSNLNALRMCRTCLANLGFSPTAIFSSTSGRYRTALFGEEIKRYSREIGFTSARNKERSQIEKVKKVKKSKYAVEIPISEVM